MGNKFLLSIDEKAKLLTDRFNQTAFKRIRDEKFNAGVTHLYKLHKEYVICAYINTTGDRFGIQIMLLTDFVAQFFVTDDDFIEVEPALFTSILARIYSIL